MMYNHSAFYAISQGGDWLASLHHDPLTACVAQDYYVQEGISSLFICRPNIESESVRSSADGAPEALSHWA